MTSPATSPEAVIDLFNRAVPLHQAGRLAEAAALYGQVLAIDPGNFDALHLLGAVYIDSGQAEHGAALIAQAVASNPTVAAAHSNLGKALLDLGRPEEALASFDRAIAQAPGLAAAHHLRGVALVDLGRLEEALASYDQALRLDPVHPATHYNRAVVLDQQMRLEEALAGYERAIALKPDYAVARWNRGLILLLLGRHEAGWRDYEWRKSAWDPAIQGFEQVRRWTGDEDVRGRTVFVYSEQGLGDTLQMCRYIRLLAERGAKPVLMVQTPLKTLLRQLTPGMPVLAEGDAIPSFDYQVPMLSLPLAFRTTLETVPGACPYLHADADEAARWARRLSPVNGRLRVGLAWAGDPRRQDPGHNAVDTRRSLRLAQLAPLARVKDVQFISLQKGAPAEQARRPPEGMDLLDLTDDLTDFAQTAALAANLDLVITVDTSVAHLAGALGKPFWVLSRFDACWRWPNGREDSPWYPTARIFHQRQPGAWADVIDRAAAALARLAGGAP